MPGETRRKWQSFFARSASMPFMNSTTRMRLEWASSNWSGKSSAPKQRKNDLAFIFFAGHGATETLPNGEKQGYLVPTEGSSENAYVTGISMEAIQDLSNRLEARHVYYAIDACYSGGLAAARPTNEATRGNSQNSSVQGSHRRTRGTASHRGGWSRHLHALPHSGAPRGSQFEWGRRHQRERNRLVRRRPSRPSDTRASDARIRTAWRNGRSHISTSITRSKSHILHFGIQFGIHFAGALPLLLLLVVAGPAGAARESGLLQAARKGDSEAVIRLLDTGADPNQTGQNGITALHIAASEGDIEVAEALLRRGAFVDQMEFDGDTPLIQASIAGHIELVRLLLGEGADANVESSKGYTAIQHSRRARHSPIVRLLKVAERQPKTQTARVAPALPQSNNRSTNAPTIRIKKKYQPGYKRRIAAVIGVNDYTHWRPLTGARGDAEKVARQLKALGFDEVLELYDGEATRDAILDLLGSKLPRVVGEDDLVVIFFAGHGQTETVGGARERKRGYIIPVDATVEGVFATAISMQKLRALTNRLPAKHVYYAMDSCYSGLGFTRSLGLVKLTEDDYINKVTSLRSVQMVTAGGEGEEAIEQSGEGVFTRSFLDALRGKADANGDGYVTATEIGAYVAPRVTNETRARQSPQSGRLEGEGEIAFKIPTR